MIGPYDDAHAFRIGLERRLLNRARQTGRPLDRLRKEVAHQRLLARLLHSAPQGSWALKGGLALLARLDERGRATSDADANWGATLEELEETLDRGAVLDLRDGFSFQIGRARPLEGETASGAFRFPVVAVLAGREFERLNLDINLTPTDRRPVDEVRLRDLLEFADLPAPVVPAIPLAQQLAEKIHAYTRSYGNGSSRPRDLYDMLVIAERLPLPAALAIVEACHTTFEIRNTDWPPQIPDPPDQWADRWAQFVRVYGIPWITLTRAGQALRGFWDPLLTAPVPGGDWDPDTWGWLPRQVLRM
jgi:predicted nucleotidyltransferase component of viral defense system